jgi:broad specificity phosphatase PhoE
MAKESGALVFALVTLWLVPSCGGGPARGVDGAAGRATVDDAQGAMEASLDPVRNDGSPGLLPDTSDPIAAGGRTGGADGSVSSAAGAGGSVGPTAGAGRSGASASATTSIVGGRGDAGISTGSKGGSTSSSSEARGGTGAAGRSGSAGSSGTATRDAGVRAEDAGSAPVDGGSSTCTRGSGTTPAVQTLVFVRHAETMENVCQSACDDESCCRAEVCAPGCDGTCSCDANVLTFSSTGWGQVGDVLVAKLKALGLAWDRILVSPSWRTQTTIKATLEAENLCGQIVPELDECWSEDSGTCSAPRWSSETYKAIAFAGGTTRLVPRPSNSQWDASASGQVLYKHTNLACENSIMDRGQQLIEDQFTAGAKAVLVVTHAMTGAGILQRLTGKSSYDLDNAAAYTVMTRASGSGKWTMVVNNAR